MADKKTMQQMLDEIAKGNSGSGFARNQLLGMAYTMTPAYALMQIASLRSVPEVPTTYTNLENWDSTYVLDDSVFEVDPVLGLIRAKVPMVCNVQANLTLDAPGNTVFGVNIAWTSMPQDTYQQAADGKDRYDYVAVYGIFDVLEGEEISLQMKHIQGSTKNIDIVNALLLVDYRPRVVPPGENQDLRDRRMFQPDEWSPPGD